jgi:hypothetical protein
MEKAKTPVNNNVKIKIRACQAITVKIVPSSLKSENCLIRLGQLRLLGLLASKTWTNIRMIKIKHQRARGQVGRLLKELAINSNSSVNLQKTSE